MKKKPKELDVDFIGGQGPLTKEEEMALSQYFAGQKKKRNIRVTGKDRKKRATTG